MKVYGDVVSGNCLKVQYTADYLAIPYEWIPIDIQQQESRSDEFLALNPAGQVPVIVLPDGRTLAQSNAIIGFLAEGSALLPGDPYDLAKVNEWLFWEQYSHEPYVAVCRFAMKYLGKSAEEREPWRVERGEIALDHLENALHSTQWLTSASFTIADIALLAYTRLAAEGGFDLATRPQVRAWIERCEVQLDIKRADDTT
jgi:glutathione S-transferase